MSQKEQTDQTAGPDIVAQGGGVAPGQLVFDPNRFTLGDMVRCGTALRQLVAESASMEEAAQRVTRYLYEHLRDEK